MALIDKASLLMVPSTYEAGTLYNVLPSGNRAPDNKGGAGYDQTRADFTFDRGSNAAATRIGSDGLIKKYRENLLLQSNSFDVSANWVNNSSTETSGFEGYDGTNDAWKLTATATSGAFIRQIISFSNLKTFSVYAKAGTSSHLLMLTEGGGNTWFDLTSGAIETDAALVSNIENIGNDWYRCSVTWSSSITGLRLYVCDADGTSSVSNGGFIYIQNAQLESGLVATDYLDSGATTAKAGVLIDLPRINYDANGENGSLLLEPSRQQLIPFSEYLGASNWVKLGAGAGSTPSITHNYTTSPEGVQNATRVQLNLNGGTSSSDQSLFYEDLGAGTGDFTRSIYIKSNSGDVDLYFGGTLSDYETISVTNEWQRFDAKTTLSSQTRYFSLGLRGTTGSSDSADILIYGCQYEAGSYSTSYIPNHGESGGVTRAADSCNGGGSAESINSTEGVLYAEISALADDSINRHITIWDGTDTNRLVLKYDNQSNVVQVFNRVGGIETAFLGHTLTDITISHKIAVRYKANDYALVIDGVEVDTDTSSSTWSASVLDNVKFSNGSGSDFYGNVKQLAVFNEALSDSELATLTTL